MSIQLRAWQQEAMQNYQQALNDEKKCLLWEATPGAGKTSVALQVCQHQIEMLNRRRIIIVVPTAHLKSQWAQAATRFQIHLDSNFKTQADWARDYHGVVVTYQQIGNSPEVFKRLGRNALVIFDEIHHAADGLTWGDAMLTAFHEAGFILCLSGTAFRSDSNPIPFVSYQDEMSIPDYVYPYGRAIEDGVCRSVAFFTYGGEMAWLEDGEVVESRFTDELIGTSAGRRLRAALDPNSGWVHTMLEDAHHMLLETRRDHPDAGGLLVAADQEHARQLAQILHEISRTKPTVVLSDEKAASRNIKKFAASSNQWIVACNMVSEGVDIPRLRVGVYATTITTKMYFRQFLGRIVRVTPFPKDVQVAYCYLPGDVRLKGQAEQIEREQRHYISQTEDDGLEKEQVEREPREKTNDWQALQSTNSGVESVIVHGGQLSLWGDPVLVTQPAKVKEVVKQRVQERVIASTKTEAKADLAKQIKHLVAQYHRQSGLPYPKIHALLNKKQKIRSQSFCTEKQLHERVQLLREMLA